VPGELHAGQWYQRALGNCLGDPREFFRAYFPAFVIVAQLFDLPQDCGSLVVGQSGLFYDFLRGDVRKIRCPFLEVHRHVNCADDDA
jgi:hypothetical protein